MRRWRLRHLTVIRFHALFVLLVLFVSSGSRRSLPFLAFGSAELIPHFQIGEILAYAEADGSFVLEAEMTDLRNAIPSIVLHSLPPQTRRLDGKIPSALDSRTHDSSSPLSCDGANADFSNSHWRCERKPGTLNPGDSLFLIAEFTRAEIEAIYGPFENLGNGQYRLRGKFSVCMSVPSGAFGETLRHICHPTTFVIEDHRQREWSPRRAYDLFFSSNIFCEAGHGMIDAFMSLSNPRATVINVDYVDSDEDTANMNLVSLKCVEDIEEDMTRCRIAGRSASTVCELERLSGTWSVAVDIPVWSAMDYPAYFGYVFDGKVAVGSYDPLVSLFFGTNPELAPPGGTGPFISEQTGTVVGPEEWTYFVEVFPAYAVDSWNLTSYEAPIFTLKLPNREDQVLVEGPASTGNHFLLTDVSLDEGVLGFVDADPGIPNGVHRIITRVQFHDNFVRIPGSQVLLKRTGIVLTPLSGVVERRHLLGDVVEMGRTSIIGFHYAPLASKSCSGTCIVGVALGYLPLLLLVLIPFVVLVVVVGVRKLRSRKTSHVRLEGSDSEEGG